MKAYGGSEGNNSTVDGGAWSASHPSRFTPGERLIKGRGGRGKGGNLKKKMGGGGGGGGSVDRWY